MAQQTGVSVDLELKAFKWGNWMGTDMAKRQSRQRIVHYFDTAEIQMNAGISARNQAIEYNVAGNEEFMHVFIDAYSAGYREQVEICKTLEAARLAKIVR